jgi:hypothetical protein
MKISGKSIMIRVDGKTIALATSCSLNVTTQMADGKTKDDAVGPTGEFDYADWNMSSENLVGANDGVTGQMLSDELLALQLAGTAVDVTTELMADSKNAVPSSDWEPANPTTRTGFTPYGGKALIDSFQLNAPTDGKASVSINFKGVSPLAKVTYG